MFGNWSNHSIFLGGWLNVAGSPNRCYPLTLEKMLGPDVQTTPWPWYQLTWQWWRWVLAEDTDLVASKVAFFTTFSFLRSVQTPTHLNASTHTHTHSVNLEGREEWRTERCKHGGEREKQAEGGTGQRRWQLSQMLSSAQNSARSHHVTANLAAPTRTTPGPATSHPAQEVTAVSWTNADAK